MDRVRFGRALGYGARHAAKTLMSAAEAASAPSPSGTQQPAQEASTSTAERPRAASQPGPMPNFRSAAAKQAGRSFLAPVKKFSSTVLQQVLGTLFALFAFVIGSGIWRMRAAFAGPQNSPEAHRLYFAVVMFVLFAYFAISSFVRADRAERR